MSKRKIIVEGRDFFEVELVYKTAGGIVQKITVLTPDPDWIEHAIDQCAWIKAKILAKDELKKLISEKIGKLLEIE